MGQRIRVLAALALSALALRPLGGAEIEVFAGGDLQLAIDGASAGDVLLVHPGVYAGPFDFKGKAIRVASTAGPTVTALNPGASESSVVRFVSGETADAVLEGFTITQGSGTEVPAVHPYPKFRAGGGVLCRNGAAPILRKCRITGNAVPLGEWVGLGGGVAAIAAFPRLVDCLVENNFATRGGGVAGEGIIGGWVELDSCLVRHNAGSLGGGAFGLIGGADSRIERNSADAGGGAWVYNVASSHHAIERFAFVENHAIDGGGLCLPFGTGAEMGPNASLFLANSATGRGGAIFTAPQHGHSGWAGCSNTAFVDNAAAEGHAIYFDSFKYGPTSLVNCTFAKHGPGDVLRLLEFAIIRNCVAWDNAGPLVTGTALFAVHSDIQGGAAGAGNIDVDPLFVDAAADDVHLLPASPCLSAGSVALAPPGLDFDGDPRVLGSGVEMGADEFGPRLYLSGSPTAGSTLRLGIVAAPTADPAILFIGTKALDPPVPIASYGAFAIADLIATVPLGPLPARGAFALSGQIPAGTIPGTHIVLQAFAGGVLTSAVEKTIW